MGIGIVWIPGGPLLGPGAGPSALDGFMEALNIHYADSIGRFCMKLNCQMKTGPELSLKFKELGFKAPVRKIATAHTFVADRNYFGDVEQRLSSNWKRNYKRSLREGFVLEVRRDIDKLEEVMAIYDETTDLKGFGGTRTKDQIKRLYECYGDRLVSFFAYGKGGLQSARIVIVFGDRAFDDLAATTMEGRKNYASYFVVYNVMKWCAENGIEMFDFCGVDPVNAKGVYNFKSGTGAGLVEYIGEKERASSPLVKKAFDIGMWLKGI